MWKIRRAVVTDAGAACHAIIRSIREICAPDYGDDEEVLAAWCANKTPEIVRTWIEDPMNVFLVAELESGALVGAAILRLHGEVSLLYITPEALGKGIGKALLDGLEAAARAEKLPGLTLRSTINARAFYARNGFLFVEEVPFRKGYPAFVMHKPLTR